MEFATTIKEAGGLSKAGGGEFLRNFAQGENEIRFLFPTDQWSVFREHFLEKKSIPCTRDETCLGCASDDPEAKKASEKVATSVWNVTYEKVDAFRIPKGVYNAAKAREERRGTILDRVAYIDRAGKGLKTEYRLDWGDPSSFDTEEKQAQKININELLKASYMEAVEGNVNAPEASKADSAEFFTASELRGMSKDELIVVATEHGLEIDEDATRKAILAEIMAQA